MPRASLDRTRGARFFIFPSLRNVWRDGEGGARFDIPAAGYRWRGMDRGLLCATPGAAALKTRRPASTSAAMQKFDVAIIGAGIVGLATGYQLSRRYPHLRLVMLEKEGSVAQHQTGHNSGVLHSGIYYKPGSLKAINCRAGKAAIEAFCREEGVPFEICGKVIVAVTEDEVPALERIFERGQANGVRCAMIDRAQLKELEPHAQGVRAIHVPESGIVDFPQVCVRLAEHVRREGARSSPVRRVTGMRSVGERSRRRDHRPRVPGQLRGQLRRAAVRSRDGHERRAAGGQDRTLPRRVL